MIIRQSPFVYIGLQTANISKVESIRGETIADLYTGGVDGTKALHMVITTDKLNFASEIYLLFSYQSPLDLAFTSILNL